jgi:polyisoprenoid-binding protein YceI
MSQALSIRRAHPAGYPALLAGSAVVALMALFASGTARAETAAKTTAAPTAKTAPAASSAVKLVPAQSEIAFTSKQMGVPVDGRFRQFDAQIDFNPRQPQAGHVNFTVELGSASLGAAETEAELAKAAWFNTAKFPKATFVSTALHGLGGGKFEATGKLTIKGTARDLVVPVTLTQNASGSVATGSFTLKRTAFKIGDGEWADTSMVADDVLVKFKLTLTGVAPL